MHPVRCYFTRGARLFLWAHCLGEPSKSNREAALGWRAVRQWGGSMSELRPKADLGLGVQKPTQGFGDGDGPWQGSGLQGGWRVGMRGQGAKLGHFMGNVSSSSFSIFL